MLQEYLPGEEYSVDVYVRRDGRVIAAVPRARMKIDSGIAVASRTVNVPEVIAAAVRTAEIIGIRGIANVQFKRAADGVFKLLEVNPRFPGTLPLTGAAGIDMPKLMADELAGRTLPDGLPAVQGADGRALLDRALSRSPASGRRCAAGSNLAHSAWPERIQCRPAGDRVWRGSADRARSPAGARSRGTGSSANLTC